MSFIMSITSFENIFDFLKKNMAISISVIPTVTVFSGGLIFFLYFHSISFTPVLDINSSVSILLAAAILGFVLIASLAGILVMPGVIWFSFYESGFIKHKKYKGLISNFIIWFFVPLFFPVLLVSLDLYVQAVKLGIFTKPIILLIALFFGVLISLIFSNPKETPKKYTRFFKKRRHQIKLFDIIFKILIFPCVFYKTTRSKFSLSFAWLYSILFGQVIGLPVLFVLFLFEDGKLRPDENIAVTLFIISSTSFFSNLFILHSLHNTDNYLRYVKALSIAFLSILILIVPLRGPGFLPSLIMRNFGWGNINGATVIVDAKGCKIIRMANAEQNIIGIDDKEMAMVSMANAGKAIVGAHIEKEKCSNNDSDLYKVNEIKILLSLGDNYYFELDAPAASNFRKIRLKIPKNHVISFFRQHSPNIKDESDRVKTPSEEDL